MPSFCVVSNCEYKYASAANISFHKFPLNSPKLLKKWIEFTDRGPDWFPSKWSSICSRHFLPSDFRIQHLRKCLNRTACPSVTMKSLDFNSIPTRDFNESRYKIKRIICRLCARGITSEGQSKNIDELSSTLVKCLPTIRWSTVENLPNEICGDCIKKLVQFSLFIDRVASVQKELFGINSSYTDEAFVFNDCLQESTTKPIIIKQEPYVNIKQEIFEFNKSTSQSVNTEAFLPCNGSAQDYYADAESDAYCEFCDLYFDNNVELKNHIVDFHSDNQCNPRERANNCEIMEIITLENAAIIDLDENCVEEATIPPLEPILKVEKTTENDHREVLLQIISMEHSYARTSCCSIVGATEDGYIVRNLKQEEMNVQLKSSIQAEQWEQTTDYTSEPKHGVEVESTELTQNEEMDTEHSNDKICESSVLPNQFAHTHKTKICPICTAHCRTIYHYFIHRSKYHNWSKPRRPKRKLRHKCNDCSKMFVSKSAFDNHKKYSCTSLQFKCSICQLEFSSGMSMLIHKRICKVLMGKSENVDSKCSKRLKNCATRKDDNALEKRYQNVCRQNPRSTKSLRHHSHRTEILSLNKSGGSVNVSSKRQNHNKEYICSCSRRFQSLRKYRAHQSSHTSDSLPPYSCDICSKRFPIRSYLYQHLVTHNNERKYKCTINSCSKAFKRLAGLNQHIRGYHYQIKPHICTVCKHSYALKGDMRRCRHSTLQNKA